MPAGRNQVDYTDIRRDAVTYKIDQSTILFDQTKVGGSAGVGLAVAYSADDTVALAADGDHVAGKLEQVFADGFCTVVDAGFVTLPAGAAAATTRGSKIVGALGPATARGYIREVASATAAELNKGRGRIVNVAVAAAVVVEL